MRARAFRPGRWVAAFAWAACIFALSGRGNLPGPGFLHADKLLHAAEFAVMAWLLSRALFPLLAASGRQARESWLAAALACFLYALSDEMHQAFVPGRMCQTQDVLADLVGILLGLAALRLFMRRRRMKFPP